MVTHHVGTDWGETDEKEEDIKVDECIINEKQSTTEVDESDFVEL